ncbi:intercellular adhesion molecule 5 isoform X1 [Genypterus blacodes]|uniref:intercellular adhesion molecule 5 isoform X1 n=1 Tax=Genypterus blacodes TaxID=154954 RepID=UPI003F76905A
MLGLFLLSILLCDAESQCFNETDHLTLEPPGLIGEYGRTYSVFCNSTFLNPVSMYWSDGGGPADLSTNVTSISKNVSLSEWNVQLHCKMRLNDSNCSTMQVPITVYQNPENVLLDFPTSLEEGTQYELRCDIINVTPLQNLKVQWYKDDQPIMDVSFKNTSKTPQNASAPLSMKISREDDGAQMRCEAKLDFGPLGPKTPAFSSSTLNISVSNASRILLGNAPTEMPTAAPTVSEAGCPLTLTADKIVVRYGDPASVTCSTPLTDHVGMGWEAALGSIGMVKQMEVTWKVKRLEQWNIAPKCFITLNAEDDEEEQQCFKVLHITLYKTPDMVSVSLGGHTGPLVEGHEYQLMCSIYNVAPVMNITINWHKDGVIIEKAVLNDTMGNVSSSLRITPGRQDHGAKFKCEVQLDLGPDGPQPLPTETSEPYVTEVDYAPRFSCNDHYETNETSERQPPCKPEGRPDPVVTWFKDGKEVDLTKPWARHDSGQYHLLAANKYGTSNHSLFIDVLCAPLFSCDDHYETEENNVQRPRCKPEGRPDPVVTWFKDGKEVDLTKPWARHDSGQYHLRAVNKYGTSNHSLLIDVLYAPELNKADYTVEVGRGEDVTLVCSAEGNPAPVIEWSVNGAHNLNLTTRERQSNITVTGATSTNAGVYKCFATNKVGRVTSSASLIVKDRSPRLSTTLIFVIVSIVLLIFALCLLICCCSTLRNKRGQYNLLPRPQSGREMFPMTAQLANGNA